VASRLLAPESMRIALLLLAAALAACAPVQSPDAGSPPATGVRLDAERTSPTAVRLRLQNGSSERIGYNLCVSALQRRDGGNWTAVRTDDVCTMELRILEPGGAATFDKTLPGGLAPGEYRYTTNVEMPLGRSQTSVSSNAFRM